MQRIAIWCLAAGILSACSTQPKTETLSHEDYVQASGIYAAYPGPQQADLTPAPEGYEPFYFSNYNRHGSRYQPNNDRYQHSLDRLMVGHDEGRLTAFGESLLPSLQLLCDSCLGHGGQLSSVGTKQLYGIGQRVVQRFPEIFARKINESDRLCHVRSRASVVPRCGASAKAFLAGFEEQLGLPINLDYSADSIHMAYIAYDTPQMRQLGSREAAWQSAYEEYKHTNVDCTPIIRRLFTDASGLDTLQTVIDLYWLVVGMQDVDVPGCNLDGVFTAEELRSCWQCVNYRMYICNANCPQSRGIPAASASTLLQNIIERADEAIASDTVAADLRFGHDSNLLRLLALARIQGATAEAVHPSKAWEVWPDYALSPMGANLQLVFYRNPNEAEQPILIKFLHNENEVLLDTPIQTVSEPYYRWEDVRAFFVSQLSHEITDDIVTVHIQ